MVADHQIAHVYLQDTVDRDELVDLLSSEDGISTVLSGDSLKSAGLDHPRAGDLVLLSDRDRWFTWDYWLDESRAPDFARTVDIHRKPGYDPRELFFAPGWSGSKPRLLMKLLAKKLGQRTIMDAISLDTSQGGGAHGLAGDGSNGVIMVENGRDLPDIVPCTAVRDLVLDALLPVG